MPWFIDLKDILEENKPNPHFDLNDYIKKNFKKRMTELPPLLLFTIHLQMMINLAFNPKDRSEPLPIPVIYVSKEAANKLF